MTNQPRPRGPPPSYESVFYAETDRLWDEFRTLARHIKNVRDLLRAFRVTMPDHPWLHDEIRIAYARLSFLYHHTLLDNVDNKIRQSHRARRWVFTPQEIRMDMEEVRAEIDRLQKRIEVGFMGDKDGDLKYDQEHDRNGNEKDGEHKPCGSNFGLWSPKSR